MGYLVEISVFLIIFIAFYKYYFHRQINDNWSRYYLLISCILSVILPLIYIPLPKIFESHFPSPDQFIILDYEIQSQSLLLVGEVVDKYVNTHSQAGHTLKDILLNIFIFIYFAGVLISIVKKVLNLMSVRKIITHYPHADLHGYKIVKTNSNLPVFSFFRFIVVNKDFLNLSVTRQEQILEHEKTHSGQWHTLDLIVVDVFSIFFWFLPVVKLYKQYFGEVHEYLADAAVVRKYDTRSYSELLMEQAVKGRLLNMASNFSKTQLRNRIERLYKNEANNYQKSGTLLAFPLLIGFLILVFFIKGILFEPHSLKFSPDFDLPVKNNYQIACGFIPETDLKDVIYKIDPEFADKSNLKVSHPRLTIIPGNFADVFAPADGIVDKIITNNSWGLTEHTIVIRHNKDYTCEISGIFEILIKEGDRVEKGHIIGNTGDNRLYTQIGFKVSHHNKPVNPVKLIR
jgi:hypothetical protein